MCFRYVFIKNSEFFKNLVQLIGEEDCPENEEYQSCGSACPTTCQNMKAGSQFCIAMCKTGCFCESSYVRNNDNGKCVLPKDC
jgi:hypothetical protein